MNYEEYFDNLCEMVGGGEVVPGLSFYKVLWILYEKPFYSIMGNDNDRAEDGLDLRVGFIDRDASPCSVLEMMIALSRRMAYIMLDDQDDDYSCDFFWNMMYNLFYLFDRFDDEAITPSIEKRINNILDRFLMRNYDYDGTGGLFPIKKPREDQRELEICYQMNAWLIENYGERIMQ